MLKLRTALVLSAWCVSLGDGAAFGDAPNIPVFSLWATEVTDRFGGPNKCTSCPTQDVPFGQVVPGDVVKVELFVSNWDAEPMQGICDGDPSVAHNGSCSMLDPIGQCPGWHCANTGSDCSIGQFCGGGACIHDACQLEPRLSAYTATVTGDSWRSAASGELIPYRVPCVPADCDFLPDGTCPCAQFYQSLSQCTCAAPSSSGCDPGTNFCGIGASMFIARARPDFLFAGLSSQEVVGVFSEQGVDFTGFLWSRLNAVADDGTRRYLGTMLLEVSHDAAGVFTLAYYKDSGATLATDGHFRLFDGFIYEDLSIDVSATPDFDNDGVNSDQDNCPNVANSDQADCDGNGQGDLCDQLCGGEIGWTTFPADGVVDAREDVDALTGLPARMTELGLTFSCFVGVPPSGDVFGVADFMVSATDGAQTAVVAVASSDLCLLNYVLVLADGLRLGEWTSVSTTAGELHADNMVPLSSALVSDIGFLPGDVDGNALSNSADVAALRNILLNNLPWTAELALSADIDRSAALTAFDLIREVDLLNGVNTTRVWNGATLPPKPN